MNSAPVKPKDLRLAAEGDATALAAFSGDGIALAEPPPRRSIHHVAALLMSGALASKLLGFGREVLMAQVIGASLIADGFRGAMTAILIPLAFLQNESVPAILIPMQRQARRDGHAAQSLGALTLALTAVAFLMMLAIQAMGAWWVGAVVGGFSAEGRALTLEFVRIMALAMPASTVLNCLASGEIALGRTRLTNIRAGLLNVSIILGILTMALTGFVSAVAWSFALAFNLLAAWALWSLQRGGTLSFSGVGPRMVLATALDFLTRLRPLLALPVAEQGHIWIERILASRLVTGAVASLDYARTLTDSALLLISQPLGLAVLSSHSDTDTETQVDSIARPVLAIAVPAAMFLAIFSSEVIRLVFFRGAFTEHGVELTSHALRGISIGLWASTLGWILLRVLNSAGRNGTVALILISAYATNVLVNMVSAHFAASDSQGILFLGFGETTRSLVLLGGVIAALGFRRRLLMLILLAMIPAALMALLGWQIHEAVAGTLPRLALGGLACLVSMAVALGILMPQVRNSVVKQLLVKLTPSGRDTK